MPIDISTDLMVSLLPGDIKTPTVTGQYSTGDLGTYTPGKDYSPTDDVSIGGTANFSFSIAFNSLGGQSYNLDKVYIQSADDPKNDGTGGIPIYWLNQDPDPENITDDGNNTIVDKNFASMSSIVFDATANISSNSTIVTNINITFPAIGFYWKTKLMPKIQIVAEKDGIQMISDPFLLPAVRLSTAGTLVTTIQNNGNPFFVNIAGGDIGFYIPLLMFTQQQNISNIANIRNIAIYDTLTYSTSLTASVNGINIPLTKDNFKVNVGASSQLVSFDYQNNTLSINLQNLSTTSSYIYARINVYVPFDPGSLTEATVKTSGNWTSSSPPITGFSNAYLFTLSNSGTVNQSQLVTIVPSTPPVPVIVPIVQETFSIAALNDQSVQQSLLISNYDCLNTLDSMFIRLIDSSIASFSNTITATISFYDMTGKNYYQALPASYYDVKYAYCDCTTAYNPNLVFGQVINGTIIGESYEQILSSGYDPNLTVITILNDLGEIYNIDSTKNFMIIFSSPMLKLISQAEFSALYDQNPTNSYPSYLYSYISIASCYSTTELAYSDVGTQLYDSQNTDLFELRNNTVYLNLGTTQKGGASSVSRFGLSSSVQQLLPFSTVTAAMSYYICDATLNLITEVSDYSKQYLINIAWTVITGYTNAFTNIPKGTIATIVLPDVLIPYLYIANNPYATVSVDNAGTTMNIPILTYQLSGNALSFEIPIELNIRPDSISVPIKFLLPVNNFSSQLSALDFDQPLVYKQDPTSLIYGFDTSSKMFLVTCVSKAFTLRGAGQDTTGLSVSPSMYERGEPITYIAVVKNISYLPATDYYMAIAVPTNQYNPTETSDNELPAYIISFNPINPKTIIYYQTESNATANDISVVKNINGSDIPDLKAYYQDIILSNWNLYDENQILPNDVIMAVCYTPDISPDQLLRVDYQVLVALPDDASTLYVNNASFHYFSIASGLTVESNVVQIKNQSANTISITKRPISQFASLVEGTKIIFSGYFVAPTDIYLYKSFRISDILDDALSLDEANTNVIMYPNSKTDFTLGYDNQTNIVNIDILNTADIAGSLIIINISAIVIAPEKINYNSSYKQPVLTNSMSLTVNDDPALISNSNTVVVQFRVPVEINKSPLRQKLPLVKGTNVTFVLSFDAPQSTAMSSLFYITDLLHPSLFVDKSGITVTASDGTVITFYIALDGTTNTLIIYFYNNASFFGQTVTITINAVLNDISKLPSNGMIENSVVMLVNQDPTLMTKSNTVTVQFSNSPDPDPVSQDEIINELIESIVFQQAAFSHILNAEGEKIQKVLELPNTDLESMLKTNDSVKDTVKKIHKLEKVLKKKLEAAMNLFTNK